jgi:tol-pal system protein YbgF
MKIITILTCLILSFNLSYADNNIHLETRITALEEQIRELNGQVEQMSFANKQLVERLDLLAADIDFRFGELSPPPFKQKKIQAVKPEPDFDQIEQILETDQPEPAPKKQPKSLIPQTNNSLGTVKVDVLDKEIETQKKLRTENKEKLIKSEYEQAFETFRQSKFAESKTKFKKFIDNHPQSKLTGNAYYWLGESYLQNEEYDQAAVYFIQGYKKFPTSKKASNSLFKLALTLKQLDKKTEACKMLHQFNREYGDSAPANLQQKVQEEASGMKCKK